ncbi:MAG: T9SS type A sorting domain-containing protein [Candidatus Marinimicrobia bacterium]|nr:T9SS type A sorting domain-containing protein [Candidatus Neomarinimicrobiota bacterium]MBL7009666.1 T9SS type A sorting domain-containing protein [Candidatus Neomarinimicrobiota bacterium]
MFKTFTIIISILSMGVAQDIPKSIHQIELEYNNTYYLEPAFKPSTGPAKPLQQRSKTLTKTVFGYHPYWQGTKWQNYKFDLLSTIAYFSAEANGSGELTDLHGWPATDLINKAHENGVEVVLTVTIFNKTDLETLLSSESNRTTLINNLVNQVKSANGDGVNIDFEVFPASQKSNLVTFVKDLRTSLRNEISHAQVTLATPAVDWSSAWDFNALARESDGLFIMGYDYYWKGSTTTGPVAPLKGGTYNITNTVNTYLSATGNNAEKILLGVPYYGYKWATINQNIGASTTSSGEAVIYVTAESEAQSYGKLWHSESETPWYRYQSNGWNQTWYDDSLSLSHKYDLAISKNLGGVGMWALGYDSGYNQLWDALKTKLAEKTAPSTPIDISITNMGMGIVAIDFSGSQSATSFQVQRVFLNSTQMEDLGTFTTAPILLQGLNANEPYYIKVRAINNYGDSDYSEVLGVVSSANSPKVLIVNGFDRVTGTNNTFDFIHQHGNAIYQNSYLFDSANNEAIITGKINLTDYSIVDWILGEEGSATSAFSDKEQGILKSFLKGGGRLFVSGSEIGYDLSEKGSVSDQLFYENFLKAEYLTDAAGGKQGTYGATGVSGTLMGNITFSFDNGSHGTYDVDWPDGIKPASNAESILKFDNVDYVANGGAGIAFLGAFDGSPISGGIVHLSVGFETIYPEEKRNNAMARILDYLDGPIAAVGNEETTIPKKLNISSLYPNPSNRSISIEFQVFDHSTTAFLTITNIMGREIVKQSIQPLAAKTQKFNWNGLFANGLEAPSGIYIAKLSQGDQLVTKKFTLLK